MSPLQKQFEKIFASNLKRELCNHPAATVAESVERAFISSGFALEVARTATEWAEERDKLIMPIRAAYERQIAELRAELRDARQFKKGEVWLWQGDGNDHLESITCPVVITANDLREIALIRDRVREFIGGNILALDDAIEMAEFRGLNGFAEGLKAIRTVAEEAQGLRPIQDINKVLEPVSPLRQTPGDSMSGMYVYRDTGPLETADH